MRCTALAARAACSSSPLLSVVDRSIDPLRFRSLRGLRLLFADADRDGLWNKATISIFLITLTVLIVLGCARNFVSPHTQRGRRDTLA